MDTFAKALKILKNQGGQLDGVLLQGVLEGFMDGVLILTLQGELVHASSYAYQILEEFTQEEPQAQLVSQEIERICQAAIDSCELYPESPVIIEAEISNKKLGVLRIRARWLQLDENEQPLILITLEDQHRTIQSLVITEAKKYGLTPREAEIWLLRRANRTYKEIATELFISLNTVKKHLKNIRTKLKFHQFRQELLVANQ
ncbi:MAG: LuxR C-terminal-related transcriptional regulator [Pseudanabaenales cyanobacterium]|nr:LuxR C-terminal-related transcriptional regulator [Pseudanabaenales cyanobacterium]